MCVGGEKVKERERE